MDLLFSNAILKMGVHATIGDVLLLGMTMIHKDIICKPPIISMIVLHYHPTFFSHRFETLLALHAFLAGQHSLKMDMCELQPTYTVPYLYLLVVNLAFSCAMNPVVEDSNWSTETICPGFVAVWAGGVGLPLVHHGCLVCLLY